MMITNVCPIPPLPPLWRPCMNVHVYEWQYTEYDTYCLVWLKESNKKILMVIFVRHFNSFLVKFHCKLSELSKKKSVRKIDWNAQKLILATTSSHGSSYSSSSFKKNTII